MTRQHDQPVPGLPAAGGAAASGSPATASRRSTTRSGCRRHRAHGGRTNPFFVDLYRTIVAGRAGDRGARAHRAGACPRCARSARTSSATGAAAGAVLLADDGARRRHRRAERREHAQRAADPGQLRAALRPRRAQRPAGAGVHVLLDAGTATTSTSSAAPSGWSPARSRRRSSTSPTRTSSARTCTRSGWRRPAQPRQLADRHPRGRGRSSRRLELRDQHRDRRSESEQRARAGDGARRAACSRRSAASWSEIDWWRRRLARQRARRAPPPQLDSACDRWRGLFRSALATVDIADGDHHGREPLASRTRERPSGCAVRPRRSSSCSRRPASAMSQSDFYSYRYLASEGFLPGYNFPRLPLSAYIPAARARRDIARRVRAAAPVPGDHRVRAAQHHLPRGRRATRSTG